jgi:hypothetical protein
MSNLTNFEKFETLRYKKASAHGKKFMSYNDREEFRRYNEGLVEYIVAEPPWNPMAEPEGKPQDAPTSGYCSIVSAIKYLFLRHHTDKQSTERKEPNE